MKDAYDCAKNIKYMCVEVGDWRNDAKSTVHAEKDPALLAQLHCYCGCDKTDGHKNLLDCFRDTHGSTCAICCGEARDAELMATRGMPVEQIRDALRARYAHGS